MLARTVINVSELMEGVAAASWRRCADLYSLDQGRGPHLTRIDDASLKTITGLMSDALQAADPIIAHARSVAKMTGNHILLSDATATIVKSFADTSSGADLVASGLEVGSVWSESVAGTSGIGTCVATAAPVAIVGRAHYFAMFAPFTCSAAPIWTPEGEFWGALNLTSAKDVDVADVQFAYDFCQQVAEQISGILFRLRHRHDRIASISETPGLPLSLNRLVAVDTSGLILGLTPGAVDFLDIGSHAGALNRRLCDLLPGIDADGAAVHVTPLCETRNTRASAWTGATRLVVQSESAQLPLDQVAGSDVKLRRQVVIARRMLDHDIPILLLGETGSGKDTFARAFHAESKRATKPYIAVNCAAIPETLLASELFGYAPGTFTGGLRHGKEGKIVAANGGTLLLDEIGDMPLELQAHLLRVLEERVITPLGSADAIPVDIRVICATHRNLADLIARHAFRNDLYFRIKGAQITLPSLRDRDDLAELIGRLIAEEGGSRFAGQIRLAPEVLDVFQAYGWPGNVRELKSVVRYILTVATSDVISLDDLPEEFHDPKDAGDHAADLVEPIPQVVGTEHYAGERERIIRALRANKWNVSKSAKQLRISRATLHRRISKLAILSPNSRS